MSTPYGTATQEVCDLLTTAGVATVSNAQDLNLPGGWLTPAKIDYDRMDPTQYVGAWKLYLVAPDNGAVESLDELSSMVDAVRTVFPVPEAEAVTITLANHSPDPMPALLIELEMNVS